MEGQPKPAARPPSGIPRPISRLPLPTTTPSKSIRPSPSRDRLQADPGLDHSRLRRPSYESLLKKPSSRFSSPAKPKEQTHPIPKETSGDSDETNTLEDASVVSGEDDGQETRGRVRQIRPSLSDRTIETISNIPPSPASVKRQSSFFNGASPIRSPSRTPSNVSSYSRSPSRSSSGQTNGNEYLSQPVSKLRLPSRNRLSIASATSLSANKASDAPESPSRLKAPSARHSIALGGGNTGPTTPLKKASMDKLNSKTFAKPSPARPSPGKTAPKSIKTDMGPPERPLNVRKTRKPEAVSPSAKRSPSTTSRYVSAASNIAEELTPQQQMENESRKASKSSNALRESIAKAKAARKAAAKTDQSDDKPAPTVQAVDSWPSIDEDPFNQLPKGSNTAVMRKRVEGARTSGTLNIAAMSLTEIPQEVIDMYEFDPDAANWFENVDLVKFIAADNELAEISDATFPDVNPDNFDPDQDNRAPQFGGLETLDLHGNVLQSLPMGIRQLHQLRALNLSNNSLNMEKIGVVFEIPTLVDLKLANNQLDGPLTSEISRLVKLEALDLKNNSLTSLPEEIGELSNLKLLDVGENKLESLPFQILSKLPLRTLNAPKNALKGTLIPESVDRFENLQILNVASNTIEVFAANQSLVLPDLQSLFIGINRIKSLPSVSCWQSLAVLSAEDNSIAELPDGLTGLQSLRNVDLTGNNITRLDEKIGLLEGLTSFRIANNPLRERKLLSMTSDEIIQDMRNRCEPDPLDTDDEGSVATQFTLAPETPALESGWQIRPGGLLDRSYSELTDLSTSKLEMINVQEIRRLELQHNEISRFPIPALQMLAETLTELDLSHNPLDTATFLSSPLELPKLQTLNLSATGLTSISSLLTNLKAPSLNVLDISNNRLIGSLPHIRDLYPELKSFLASDNRINSLDFEAVQGLQVLDVSNNDIEYLPPKIGLLSAERSPRNWGSGSALRRFEVAGNRFRVPRWQVVAKGTDAVLQFLKEHIPAQDVPEWEEDDLKCDEF